MLVSSTTSTCILLYFISCFFFFFSSRRRHTRSDRDWSSDVCSSDLELLALDVQGTHPLLLLDVDLPALDGYSIFDALQRERPGTYRVVFTTVHGTEEEQLRGLEAGALDYLVKPMSLRVALEKIKRWGGR